MSIDKRIEQLTRSGILELLTEDEVAYVANAETQRLPEGDELIDLEHPERGVLISEGPTTPYQHVIPRSAVREATWAKILALLQTPLADITAPMAPG